MRYDIYIYVIRRLKVNVLFVIFVVEQLVYIPCFPTVYQKLLYYGSAR